MSGTEAPQLGAQHVVAIPHPEAALAQLVERAHRACARRRCAGRASPCRARRCRSCASRLRTCSTAGRRRSWPRAAWSRGPTTRITRIDGDNTSHKGPPEAAPSSWPRRMRSPMVGSSPVMPPKYHLMCTWPLVATATSRANALSSRAQAVPAGAMVPRRSVTSSARARGASDDGGDERAPERRSRAGAWRPQSIRTTRCACRRTIARPTCTARRARRRAAARS